MVFKINNPKTKNIKILVLELSLFFGGLMLPESAFALTDFVSTIKPSGGDYTKLSTWEDAIDSNLTVSTSRVYAVSSRGTYVPGAGSGLDDGRAVTFTGGGTGTLMHINGTDQAYITGVAGTVNVGTVTIATTGHTFTISDTGDQIGQAIAECYKGDYTSSGGGLNYISDQVTIGDWTTDADNYVKIYTPRSERHTGKSLSGGNYTGFAVRAPSDYSYIIDICESYTQVQGIITDGLDLAGGFGFRMPSGLSDTTLLENIAKNSSTGFYIDSGTVHCINCLAENNLSGGFLFDVYSDHRFYNCTAVGNGTGFARWTSEGFPNQYLKNCLSYNNTNDFDIIGAGGIDHSASGDGTADDLGGTGNITGIGNPFVDSVNGDYHLASSASSILDQGADLSADPDYPFSTDIDSQARPYGTEWDIGADEYRPNNPVYYSVGQDSTTNRMTGTPTVTIASGVATFSEAQTGNIGVGDRITYNTSSIAYISGKVSQAQWNVVTATGQTPNDITGSTVVSIKREYTSLSAAEAGATDSNHLNTTDLVAGNYQLNFPCYYDTGADTTTVTINGYTTGSANYIRVYTPVSATTEANQNQRHNGKWNDTRYSLSVISSSTNTLYVSDNHIYLEGLQIYKQNSGNAVEIGDIDADGEFRLGNSLVRGNSNDEGVFFGGHMEGRAIVWNSIFYNNGGMGLALEHWDCWGAVYVYNCNSINNGGRGFNLYSGGSPMYLKNSLSSGNGGEDFYSQQDMNPSSCASSDDTADDFGGAGNRINQTFSFVDVTPGSEDFHLRSDDSGAKNFGTDLSADPDFPFDTDIDGDTRPIPVGGAWDIGADETESNVVEIQTSQNNQNTSGLLAGWSFDGPDMSAAAATDISGNGYNLALSGSPSPVTGKRGSGLSFNGTSAYGYFQTDPTFQALGTLDYRGGNSASSLSSTITNVSVGDLLFVLVQREGQANCTGVAASSPALTFTKLSTALSGYAGFNTDLWGAIATQNSASMTITASYSNSATWGGMFSFRYSGGGMTSIMPQTTNAHTSLQSTSTNRTVPNITTTTRTLMIAAGTDWNNYNVHTAAANWTKRVDADTFGNDTTTQFVHERIAEAGTYPNGNFATAASDQYMSLISAFDISSCSGTIPGVKTVSFWAKPSSTSQYVLDLDGTTHYVRINSGTISAPGFATPAIYVDGVATTTFPDTSWHHVTITTDTAIDADALSVGKVGSNYFSGALDELRFYGDALSADQIGNLYRSGQITSQMSLTDKLTDGLVGMWSFDGPDVSGNTAYDRSPVGTNHGTISGATLVRGKKGSAMSFDGTTSYVNVGSASSLDDIETQGGGGMTVSAWIYARTYGEGNAGIICAKNEQTGGTSGTWALRYTSENRLIFLKDYVNTDLRVISAVNSVPYNKWQHVALTWSGGVTATSDVKIYIDGVEVPHASNQNGDGTKNSDNLNNLYIGNNNSSSATFDGFLDEVRIYNRILSSDEIRTLYRLGQARIE